MIDSIDELILRRIAARKRLNNELPLWRRILISVLKIISISFIVWFVCWYVHLLMLASQAIDSH